MCRLLRYGKTEGSMDKILVVEDDPDTRELMHLYFKYAGFVVVAAADGKQGLHLAKAEKPDLIITDVEMPNMDGITMIKQLRSEPETATIPIVVCTASAGVTDEEVIKAGANNTLYKPVDFSALVEFIRSMIAPDDERAY
jgi:CheY-like chemotaxis protein